MGNKAQKQKNGNDKNAIDSTSKIIEKNDIFISYRHLSKDDHDYRHSTSLARSVAQEFERKGYSVYFDCWDNPNKCLEVLKKSEYFIILVTKYTFDSNEKGGGFFKEELQTIKEITDKTESKKDNVFLLEVDNAYSNNNTSLMDALQKFAKTNLTGTINQLLTDQNFSNNINQLIKKPEHKGEKKIGKPSKLSTEKKYKWYRLAFFFLLLVLSLVSVLLGTRQKTINEQAKYIKEQNSIIMVKDTIIKQYKKECIVFAGGGTVQQYLNDTLNNIGVRIDVKNYQDYPSKYIHLPSKDAWTLLWDDVNEDEEKNRTYCPIVLSTTRIDIREANIEKFKKKRRIVEYEIGAIPLMVQIFDGQNSRDPITLDSLKEMLRDTSHYEIWTTTERSGTYREYKEFLEKGKEFNLDNLVNNQKGGRKNFNPTSSGEPGNKTQLFLANQSYYYTLDEDKGRSDRIVVTDAASPKKTISVPLYVYTVAVKGSGDPFKLLPQAEAFFNLIGCDTINSITERDSIVVRLDKP